MPLLRHPHIFLQNKQETTSYTTPRRPRGPEAPTADRDVLSAHLKKQWAAIWAKAREKDPSRVAVSHPTRSGVYVEYEGIPGYDLQLKPLESLSHGIRLLNVYSVSSPDHPEKMVTRATVFIPSGKENIFLKKLDEYANENTTKKERPKHEPLMRSISNIRTAILESFWSDQADLLPDNTVSAWCEIWLSSTENDIISQFQEIASSLGIELQDRILYFPERSVMLGKATKIQLSNLIGNSPDIAEFRRAKETPRFFLELENKDQTEWVEDLLSRLSVNKNVETSVCVLDTGANNGHPLLSPVLTEEDCQSVDPSWGVADKDGHGTLMCGLSAYGDLTEVLQSGDSIFINHKLESVKILPHNKKNNPDLYGELTIQGVLRAEIQDPDSKRICCMAVTADDNRNEGKPSSWSAAIDKVSSGYDDDIKRLIIISGGNIYSQEEWKNYPFSNLQSSIQDPGQSWNALTVGAYTTKSYVSDPELRNYTPVAEPDTLSPFSTTSSLWETKWPIKPEIVLEGGNLLSDPSGFIGSHEDLSLLSTSFKPQISHFEVMHATSAATGLAGRMAAQIQAMYPNAWPETIRGLMIHSASWTDKLIHQFCRLDKNGKISKTEAGKLLRICGYGVPNRDKALSCLSNSLTLISEAELQPYIKKGSTYHTKDMHVHRLPWPKSELLSLGETPVKLRITLSYFIEPGPGEIGWKERYRYPSYGLRFSLNRFDENEDEFIKRLNIEAREDGEEVDSESGCSRWLIGSNSRDTGSIHSDIWEGTAAEIASCNLIGVSPIIGWWRERHWLNRWDKQARYSLIVSLETPQQEVDIYTPVSVQIENPVINIEI